MENSPFSKPLQIELKRPVVYGLKLILLDGVEASPISLFAGDIRIGFNLTLSF